MGILSYAVAGGIAGAGKGISEAADLAARERIRDEQIEREAALRREMLLSRGGGGGGSGGRGGSGASLASLAGMSDAERMGAYMDGGMTREQAADLVAMRSGNAPTVTRAVEDESGGHAETVGKYTEGQGAQLAQRGFSALRRAMGLTEPAAADDIAKAETEEQRAGNIEAFAQGDVARGRAAMVAEGKPVFGEAGDVLTGQTGKGTVAESKVIENKAQAGQAGAAAGKYREEAKSEVDKREGRGSIKEDLNAIDGQRKKLASDLADVRAQEAGARKSFDDTALTGLQARRAELEQQSRSLDARYEKLAARLDEKAGAKADKPKGDDTKPKAADKFNVGKTYKDSKGNRAVYLGGGKWGPMQ